MRVLAVHNYYQQPGGEDRIFEAESSMLERHGCRVFNYTVHNDHIKGMNPLTLSRSTLWNKAIARELRKLIQKVRPDIIHFHNTFPLISPAAYYVAKEESIPVVQTLHNYRLLCPNALLFRNGHICEDCMGKFVSWPGVLNACYRENRAATSVIATMLSVHRVLRTYRRMVDIYIALTDFASQKFIRGGIAETKIVVKPNFVDPDPGIGDGSGGYALFVGRLSQEKGIDTLLSSWEIVGNKLPLKIVGDGLLASQVVKAAQQNSVVEFLGRQSGNQVLRLMKDAIVLIFPSIWYECFPVTIVEAYSVGLPVIASNLGSMSTLIDHRRTGLHFNPSDPEDLSKQVDWIINHPEEFTRMRGEARSEYEAKYTAERNFEMLMEIYERAIACSR